MDHAHQVRIEQTHKVSRLSQHLDIRQYVECGVQTAVAFDKYFGTVILDAWAEYILIR